MRRAERIAKVEQGLLDACAQARRTGLTIVCEAFDVERAGRTIGVCAMGAANWAKVDLALSSGPRLSGEYDAIEAGFDGTPWRDVKRQAGDVVLDRDFYKLGLRLRKALAPVRAGLLS